MERDYEQYVDDEVSSIQWEETIKLQEMFEDSALQDAVAYARTVNNGSKRFKKENNHSTKENNDGAERTISTK